MAEIIKSKLRRLLRLISPKKDPHLRAFNEEYELFKQLDINGRFKIDQNDFYMCLDDKTSVTNFDSHYIYHPAWAARIIKAINPDEHVDFSSTLHFCSILSAFVKTKFYDFRPASLQLDNLDSLQADLTELHFESNSISSISCMHTIEHIGLGRYADPIDPNGDLKAIKQLMRVCAVNGNLLIVVPVGKQRILFNAHRIYDPREFRSYFDDFELVNFSLVTDNHDFINDAGFDLAAEQKYGCGCYWFKKKNLGYR